jgi:hypothetical protein
LYCLFIINNHSSISKSNILALKKTAMSHGFCGTTITGKSRGVLEQLIPTRGRDKQRLLLDKPRWRLFEWQRFQDRMCMPTMPDFIDQPGIELAFKADSSVMLPNRATAPAAVPVICFHLAS